MELRVLKYFLMVAREENITKAAIIRVGNVYRCWIKSEGTPLTRYTSRKGK